MPKFEKILVGIDGSERSYKAASYAAELAGKYGAKVTLMYVASSSTYTDRFSAKPTYVPKEDILAGEIFDPAKKMLDDKGVTFEIAMELGNPAQLLLDRSKQDFDLVVVGAKGVSGIQGFLMGSVSSRVVQHSQVPVMVVP